MAAHRYWRLYILTNWGHASFTVVGGIELRSTIGGANESKTGFGTASSSAPYDANGIASNAFDEDTTTAAAPSGTAAGKVIAWDFGSGNEKEIAQVAINLTRGTPNWATTGFLKTGRIEFSDNNTTWEALLTTTELPQVIGTYTFDAPIIITGSAGITIPSISSVSNSGASSLLSLSQLAVSGLSGYTSAITIPALTSTATGHNSSGERALDFMLPSLAASATAGGNSDLTLPAFTSVLSGTVTSLATSDITLPAITTDASVKVSAMASLDLRLPAFSSSAYTGALCSVTLGKLTLQATGTTGGIGGAQITLPLFHATAVATAQNHGYANIVLPALGMHSGGNGAAVSLPALNLTAIGTAVVTATYEAYAVNLKHTQQPGDNTTPVDEMTHYTNFPFTHVVRYKNSYYGANSTGLYLLEGTTDAGTAIPWAVQTAMTDFGDTHKKTISAALFSGRFGPASTVSLIAGEQTPTTYNFSTPRDQLAQNHRQVFGKGLKERYYALGASGSDTMQLDTLELDVNKLSRRI